MGSGRVGDVARQKQVVADAQLIAAVVEHSDDAIIGSTLDGIITSWNPAAERMYGYSSERSWALPLTACIPKVTRPRCEPSWAPTAAVSEQLQEAMESRIVIEQAKG